MPKHTPLPKGSKERCESMRHDGQPCWRWASFVITVYPGENYSVCSLHKEP